MASSQLLNQQCLLRILVAVSIGIDDGRSRIPQLLWMLNRNRGRLPDQVHLDALLVHRHLIVGFHLSPLLEFISVLFLRLDDLIDVSRDSERLRGDHCAISRVPLARYEVLLDIYSIDLVLLIVLLGMLLVCLGHFVGGHQRRPLGNIRPDVVALIYYLLLALPHL